MADPDADSRFSTLRHDLANPLSAVLAETQLLLLNPDGLDPDTRQALQTIEAMALKMRAILRSTTG